MALNPGTIVDRYILEGILGEGGMAVVYRARHRDLGSLHAIKQLRVTDPGIRQRLLQEGRLQSGLRHPNVVSVTDLISLDDTPALVMEFIKGPSLAELLHTHRPSLTQCDAIARGILKGVAAAHGHGLVHRDLKPANILIAVHDDELVPKIADFGLAKLLEGNPSPHGMTREGTAMGTPGYMAPEQINDSRGVDKRADIFSLGAILYELVSGQLCFEGEGVMAVWQAIGRGEFVPPQKHVPDLPGRMLRAIEGALQVDREQRIANVSSLLSIWATDEQGTRVPVVANSSVELSAEGPRALAHALTMAKTRDLRDMALDHTRDSADLPSPPIATSPTMAPPSTESSVPPAGAVTGVEAFGNRSSSALPWALLAVVVGILAVTLWLRPAEGPAVTTQTPSGDAAVTAQAPRGNAAVEPAVAEDTDAFPSPTGHGLFRLDEDPSETDQVELNRAQKALLAGHYPKAQKTLTALLDEHRKSRQVHTLLALTHVLQDRNTLSAVASRRATRWARDRDDLLSQAVRLADRSWREVDNGAKLLPAWELLRAQAPDDPTLELLYLVSTRNLVGADSLEKVRAAQQRFSDVVAFVSLELRILSNAGRHRKVIEVGRRALAPFPDAACISGEIGRAQVQLGQIEKAQRTLTRALEKSPNLVTARVTLAGLHVRKGDEEGYRLQMMISLSDTVPPWVQVDFLVRHARNLSRSGQPAQASKFFDMCQETALHAKSPDQALECADAVVDAHVRLLPVEKWTTPMDQMHTLLARPDLDPSLRQFYSLRLMSVRAIAAARTNKLREAESFVDQMADMKDTTNPFDATPHFEREARWALALAWAEPRPLMGLIEEYRQAWAKPGPRRCALYDRKAQAMTALDEAVKREAALVKIAGGDCVPGANHGFVLAESRVNLAAIRLRQHRKDEAKALLDAFDAAWPEAQRNLALVQRASELRAALKTP